MTDTDAPADFPVSIRSLVGEKLRLSPSAARGSVGYELTSSRGQRVASLSLYNASALARMACAEGAWRVDKRRRYGWELIIEAPDGRLVGWYSGRRWLPGGTIFLADGSQVDLRRSANGHWKLQTSGTREAFVVMRASRPGTSGVEIALEIRSGPAGVLELPLTVLIASTVVILDCTLPGPPSGSGGR